MQKRPTLFSHLQRLPVFVCATALALVVACRPVTLQAAAPNIVVIMADDLGCHDLGYSGSTFYETPHIDRLAASGLQFTSAYAACPVCSPTRAAAMTGKYPARLKLTDFIPGARRGRLNPAFYVHQLPLAETTVAEGLGPQGYANYFVGKWHLGGQGFWPTDQGFALNIGGSEKGANRQFAPYELPNLDEGPTGEYLTDRLTDEAVKFINTQQDGPFLLWLAHYDVHTPLVAKQDYIDRFTAKAQALPPATEPRFRPEGSRQDRRVQDHAIYAAKVASLDDSIGRVMRALSDRGLADNTLVVFTSDNGGLSTSEGAPTSNAPLRAGKGWLYEGGLRVPLLIAWPAVVGAGRQCDTPVITNDLFPTLLAAAEQKPPADAPMDGQSLLPILRGAVDLKPRSLYWHYPHYGNQGGIPGGAIRDQNRKLIEFFEDNHVELYDLARDPGEMHDLAAEQPDVAARLRTALADWRKEVSAEMPSVNPDYSPDDTQR